MTIKFSLSVYIIGAWLLLESVAYLQFKWKLHKLQAYNAPSPISARLRRQLFSRIMDYFVTDHETRTFLSNWFFGARFDDLHSENIRDWIAYAMFAKAAHHLSADEGQEATEMLGQIEEKCERKLPEGRNAAVRCARHTLDPMQALHRPMAVYLAIDAVGFLTGILLRWHGFRKFQTGSLTYWFRASQGQSKECQRSPIVFVHGVGIGLLPYVSLVCHAAKNRSAFLVELPYIAMKRCCDVPSAEQSTSALVQMLLAHSPEPANVSAASLSSSKQALGATFIGHSFGSILVSHMIKFKPQFVRGAVLLDPVCFLLFLPDICLNFVYRRPTLQSCLYDWVLHYFTKRELHIVYALTRHFWWYRNILWLDELCCPTAVFLAGRDEIVPTQAIYHYLQCRRRYWVPSDEEEAAEARCDLNKIQPSEASQDPPQHTRQTPAHNSDEVQRLRESRRNFNRNASLNVVRFPNYRHGECLMHSEAREAILAAITALD